MDVVLLLGAGLFALSSIYFFVKGDKKFNSAFFVSLITTISYLVMYQGFFLGKSPLGESVYYTRWLFYGLSCTLLVYYMGKMLKRSNQEITSLIYLTAIVMVTGALSSVSDNLLKILFFLISLLIYIALVYKILNKKSKSTNLIKPYIIFGWSVFPIVFLFSPEGFGVISNLIAAFTYLLLDLFTKIIFYLQTDNE